MDELYEALRVDEKENERRESRPYYDCKPIPRRQWKTRTYSLDLQNDRVGWEDDDER